jgi:hypothetical protein
MGNIYDYRQRCNIEWENLKQDDVIYIYIDFTITIKDVPFWFQLNICFKILHEKFVRVYYGMDHVENIVSFGAKASSQDVLKLMPELEENGYKLYE